MKNHQQILILSLRIKKKIKFCITRAQTNHAKFAF